MVRFGFPISDRHGPFLRCRMNGQVYDLQGGLVLWKHPAILYSLANHAVQCKLRHMSKELTFASILSSALDPEYMPAQAMDDLSKLMNEAALMQIQGNTDSPRYAELQSIIPVQERLAKAKLDGHPIFDRLGNLCAKTHKDD